MDKEHIDQFGIESVDLNIPANPITRRMSYIVGNFKIDREQYWLLSDNERQELHNIHNSGSKAIPFNPTLQK